MRFILAGTALVFRTPRLWRFIIQPLLVGALAFMVVAAGAYWLIVPTLSELLRHPFGDDGFRGEAATAVANLVFMLLFIVVSGSLYLVIVSFFSSTLWEKLSFAVELESTGKRVETKLPIPTIIGDSLQRGISAIAIGFLSMCCGWAVFGIVGVLLAGFMGLYDYTSAAYLRRGITFAKQGAYLRKLPSRYSFAVCGGLLTLLPVVNVLMLPCLVAGGTLMVIESEREEQG
jgi:uncharacterized protein involved in cysteine biosynthesis